MDTPPNMLPIVIPHRAPSRIGQQEIVRTMNPHKWRLAVPLCLALLAGCGQSSGEQGAASLLNERLQLRLAPDLAAGNVVLQPLPGGAQVTLLGPSISPGAPTTTGGRDVRADVVESLLDPRLIQIQLADTSPLSDYQRDARVRDMTQYLTEYGLGPTLQPAAPPQSAVPVQAVSAGSGNAAPAGLTITISVQCPDHYARTSKGSDEANPYCH